MSVQEALIKLHTINMQAQQALLAGLPPPVPALGPAVAAAPVVNAVAPPAPLMLMAGAQPIGGALTKAQREIYVGSLPPGVTVPHLFDFVNVAMRQLGVNAKAPVGSVVSAWVSTDGHYAFVELRTPEEANAVMAYLSGLQLGMHSLKVGRPKGVGPNGMVAPLTQTPFTAAMLGLGPHPGGVPTLGGIPMPPMPASMAHLNGLAGSLSGAVASVVNSTDTDRLSNVVMATNLPLSLNERQIEELFSPFGKVIKYELFLLSC
jgi:splicing factor U2AF subunit